jgi:hypothetical protein
VAQTPGIWPIETRSAVFASHSRGLACCTKPCTVLLSALRAFGSPGDGRTVSTSFVPIPQLRHRPFGEKSDDPFSVDAAKLSENRTVDTDGDDWAVVTDQVTRIEGVGSHHFGCSKWSTNVNRLAVSGDRI